MNILLKEEKDKVVGEIYKITNIVNNKSYIGQTRSHRLNHGKYRPFGYLGRFKDHLNEANSNKKKQCNYLNNALLKYGKENFICELIETCNVDCLDDFEKKYIIENNTKYPNGYNLTNGGKCFKDIKETILRTHNNRIKKSTTKSESTKKLISQQLKYTLNNPETRTSMMRISQKQHIYKKFEKFKDVDFNIEKIDDYIRVIKNKRANSEYVEIHKDKKKVSFVGKYETIQEIKNRAKRFIFELKEWQRNQIAGNSLEPNTTTHTLETLNEEHD